MSSLDETYEAIAHYSRALAEFNDALRVSVLDLDEKHEVVQGLWADSAARAYAQIYEPMRQHLEKYLAHEAPRLETFIETKVRVLDAYLNGR